MAFVKTYVGLILLKVKHHKIVAEKFNQIAEQELKD
jgi:hypothetical protein